VIHTKGIAFTLCESYAREMTEKFTDASKVLSLDNGAESARLHYLNSHAVQYAHCKWQDPAAPCYI